MAKKSLRQQIIEFCERNKFEYQELPNKDKHYDYRNCIEIYPKDPYMISIYVSWNYKYEAHLRDGYSTIAEILNFDIFDLIDFMGEYDLLP